MGEVDLEALAAGYEHRPMSRSDVGRALFAAESAGLVPGDRVVDFGGGRGGHSSVFADLGAYPIVMDPSAGMVVAAADRGVDAIRAVGESVPIQDGGARLAYFHLSIHHGDWKKMLGEADRVTAPGGSVFVWTLSPEHHRTSFLTRWFPSIERIDRARFPHPDEMRSRLIELGNDVETGEAVQRKETTVGAWACAVRGGFVSTLQLVDRGELERGLERFHEAYPDPDAALRYQLSYAWVHGTLPSLA